VVEPGGYGARANIALANRLLPMLRGAAEAAEIRENPPPHRFGSLPREDRVEGSAGLLGEPHGGWPNVAAQIRVVTKQRLSVVK